MTFRDETSLTGRVKTNTLMTWKVHEELQSQHFSGYVMTKLTVTTRNTLTKGSTFKIYRYSTLGNSPYMLSKSTGFNTYKEVPPSFELLKHLQKLLWLCLLDWFFCCDLLLLCSTAMSAEVPLTWAQTTSGHEICIILCVTILNKTFIFCIY